MNPFVFVGFFLKKHFENINHITLHFFTQPVIVFVYCQSTGSSMQRPAVRDSIGYLIQQGIGRQESNINSVEL